MSGREALYEAAAALTAAPGLSARASRLERRLAAPALTFDDLAATPAWTGWTGERLTRLMRLAGGVGAARAWRPSVDGRVLSAAARSLGEAALDALLSMPNSLTPAIADPGAETGASEALERLGARVLLTEVAGRPGLAERLRRRLPGSPQTLADPSIARDARRTAEALMMQTGGAA